tara:strand:+ start:1416 stop:3767 length:2352 start_codon:yes stop_codon:yes gene_type:complete
MPKMKALTLALLMMCSLTVSIVSAQDGDDSATHSLSGTVYDTQGNIADTTYIKVVPMASVLSDSSDGSYEFTGISTGLHAVRAYFMNNGHTVSYRALYLDSDLTLDWVEGSNWITMQFEDTNGTSLDFDSSNVSVTLLETGEQVNFNSPLLEFNLNPIGQYYTLKTVFDGAEEEAQYLHFRMNHGNGVDDMMPNHFVVQKSTSNLYGYVYGTDGLPLADTTISSATSEVITNSDGFYRFENLALGSNHTFSFEKSGDAPLTPQTATISSSSGWMNFSATQSFEYPGPAQFIESEKTIGMEPYTIEWIAGNITNSYHLNIDGELLYSGINTYYEFTPETQGSYEFTLVSFNPNGTTTSPDTLLLIALGDETGDDLWSVGMSWNYKLTYMPMHEQNLTITALEKESITDAFDVEQTAFKTRHKYDTELEGEKSYRWYDSTNLLPIRTYWRDAPFESSYFQEGTLGWDFTESNSTIPASLFSSSDEFDLHFNRTNVIGVPGHPNGYDDTMNRVTRNYEEITTPAGTFQTTHYSMVDLNDGIVSWELWYSDTVRNFVKKIDRLPGSHSEQVTYELTSFDVPTAPQFLNEAGNISSSDYTLEWAEFQGAQSYTLLEGGSILYQGNDTSFEVIDQQDGVYTYQILANMPNNFQTQVSEVELNVFEIITVPEVLVSNVSVVQGESVTISWPSSENAVWYSILLQNDLGETTEYYNGTSSSVDIDDLEPGLNRLRVRVGSGDGKVSDYSTSVFITVEADSEPTDSQFFEILFTVGMIALFGWILTTRAQKD